MVIIEKRKKTFRMKSVQTLENSSVGYQCHIYHISNIYRASNINATLNKDILGVFQLFEFIRADIS